MDEGLLRQIGTYQHRLDHLLGDGLDLRRRLAADPASPRNLEVMRAWQRECAATIGQLSGGSKAHWLSRAYSEAFLVRVTDAPASSNGVGLAASAALAHQVAAEVPAGAIVARIMTVLRDAKTSLAEMQGTGNSASSGSSNGDTASQADRHSPSPRRFTFVHDRRLAPRLEQAFLDAQAALDRGDYGLALVTSASMLEAIITDALEHAAAESNDEHPRLGTDSTFDARIEAAERAGLISRACARLPAVARQYRGLLDESGELCASAEVEARDAKVAGQVLRLVMRDLAPGR